MKTWLTPSPLSVPSDFQQALGGQRLVAESLWRRGIQTIETAQTFLNPAAYAPASPYDLPDMDKAVSRLQKAIRQQEMILIWGDFDVDGQTSTALLVSALRDLGAKLRYHIPNRFTEGHGIFLPTFKKLLDEGIQVVLTCDTGIAAHGAIAHAQSRGIDVIITDHHSLPASLPAAYAAVNPMRLPAGHPLRELPGVGTAYKLVEALYGNQSTEHLLDLVALGIVADVMILKDDTRYLLQRGLEVLRNNPREALKAMMVRAEINPSDLTEMEIGFALAPRLNALGRLADANPAIEFLCSTDSALIAEQVNALEGLNQRRKFLSRQVYEAAKEQIQREPALLKYAALVISGADWHTGVVGIVASRLVEDYGCPVVVLSERDGLLSGSARSVAGANIVEALTSEEKLLLGYGGHNMAAGLRIETDKLFEFRRGLSQTVRDMLGKEIIQPELKIDAFVQFPEINLDFAEEIARLAPFGNGNPPLTLATEKVKIKSRRKMGNRGDHLDLVVEDMLGAEQRVVWWFGDIDALPEGYFDMAYTVRSNVFKGKRSALIEWIDARVPENTSLKPRKVNYSVIDYRHESAPEKILEQVLREHEDILIWSEGDTAVKGLNRYQLTPAKTLVVWTIPPDIVTWRSALEMVQPETLILFNKLPPFQEAKAFVTQIVGLAKYAQRAKASLIHLSEIAALTGQSEQSVLAALRWIHANTEMRFLPAYDDAFRIELDTNPAPKNISIQSLKKYLDETAAYRKFWLKQSFLS